MDYFGDIHISVDKSFSKEKMKNFILNKFLKINFLADMKLVFCEIKDESNFLSLRLEGQNSVLIFLIGVYSDKTISFSSHSRDSNVFMGKYLGVLVDWFCENMDAASIVVGTWDEPYESYELIEVVKNRDKEKYKEYGIDFFAKKEKGIQPRE